MGTVPCAFCLRECLRSGRLSAAPKYLPYDNPLHYGDVSQPEPGARRPKPSIVQGQGLGEQEQMTDHDLSQVPLFCQPHSYLYGAAAVG